MPTVFKSCALTEPHPLSAPMLHTTGTRAFLHIPKAGSSTLRHIVSRIFSGTDNGRDNSSLRHVAFVRHPLDRFISGAFEATQGAGRHPYTQHVDDVMPLLHAMGLAVDRPTGVQLDSSSVVHQMKPQLRLDRFTEHFLAGMVNPRSTSSALVQSHLHPITQVLSADRNLTYIGLMDTMLEEIDALEGPTLTRLHKRFRGRPSTAGNTSTYTLSVAAQRGVCRAYLADVCCLDITFRHRCELVGVYCPAPQELGSQTSRKDSIWQQQLLYPWLSPHAAAVPHRHSGCC